jgi:hypothetical protein
VSAVRVRACSAIDPTCSHPVTPEVMTRDDGVADLSVPGDFAGIYAIERHDSFPELYYPGRLVAREPSVTYPISSVPNKTFGALGGSLRVSANHDVSGGPGHIIAIANDCDDRHVPGIVIELQNVKAGFSFYLEDNLPNPMATETGTHGAEVFLNVPEGNVEVRAWRARDHRVVATMNVYVKSGGITFVDLRPRLRGP